MKNYLGTTKTLFGVAIRHTACAVPFLLAAACNKDETIVRPTVDPPTYSVIVYEYRPAPGQFINEQPVAGFTGAETTAEAAAAYAQRRLDGHKLVSLGAFGGYIVVGFGQSVPNSGGYDFAVEGNAFDSASGSSNEPGIVWVMPDSNGNGLPDDTWYELQGSETGHPETVQNYSVTYTRPTVAGEPVTWRDSDGQSGTIERVADHKQDSYYPAWISDDSYTLSGTRLASKSIRNHTTGLWENRPFAWGYADNKGSDILGDGGQRVGFKIANAVRADGSPAELEAIDFVKVQTGVHQQCGPLGELSTEVLGFYLCSAADNQ
ncbi:MAG: hypothetical protein K2K43_05805 [Alistipes sp.]|nr:hypothetical protein [Alistipes sp.]